MWFTIEHKQHKKTAYEKILQRKQSSQNDAYIEPSYLKEERPFQILISPLFYLRIPNGKVNLKSEIVQYCIINYNKKIHSMFVLHDIENSANLDIRII